MHRKTSKMAAWTGMSRAEQAKIRGRENHSRPPREKRDPPPIDV